MSLSKSQESIFSAKNIAIMAGVGILAGGLIYWAFNDPEYRLNDKLVIKIFKQITRETFISSLEMSDLASGLIVALRKQGQIKSKSGEPLTPEESRLLQGVIEKIPDFLPKITLKIETICAEHKIPRSLLIDYEKRFISSRSGFSEELLKAITDLNILTTETLQGRQVTFYDNQPPYLTKVYITKILTDSSLHNLRSVAEIIKTYIAKFEPIQNNPRFIKEVKPFFSGYQGWSDTLEKDHPEIKNLNYHPLNYLLIAMKRFSSEDEEGFGKWSKDLNLKFNLVLQKLLEPNVNLRKVGQLVSEFEEFVSGSQNKT